MARQVGLLKLVGTLGDISFYKSFYGFLARAKTGVDRQTILRDPRFRRTRENASEFGRAAKAGKLLRDAIRPVLKNAKDSMTVQRLTQKMVKVLQADPANKRGKRTVTQGELGLLKGFDFNINARLDNTLQISFQTVINPVSGIILLTLNSFRPITDIKVPTGTTHFKILFGAAALNFETIKFLFSHKDSGILSYDGNAVSIDTIFIKLSPNLSWPIFLVLGIEFYQEVNGAYYSLEDGAFNALGIIEVVGQ
ncbi:hypothetical protein A7A78_03165 [Aequorivita soesokkakensis]|uniref:Uncharacterized protein n=1 Tax=Aequorivita soesokkakensis TaxID=1385699 RepID=A0A1A9LEJ7_9FLAO|nr:hypothetical protein [Aequorivita soesokkakensis]OAD91507.1 hypothetical protein A7A78_03165 [Aequorivita soesokkakensis]